MSLVEVFLAELTAPSFSLLVSPNKPFKYEVHSTMSTSRSEIPWKDVLEDEKHTTVKNKNKDNFDSST
jgi:hypothetical protein